MPRGGKGRSHPSRASFARPSVAPARVTSVRPLYPAPTSSPVAPTPAPAVGTNLYGDNSTPRDAYVAPGEPSPMFLPGDPIRPVPGLDDHERPRQFQYQV